MDENQMPRLNELFHKAGVPASWCFSHFEIDDGFRYNLCWSFGASSPITVVVRAKDLVKKRRFVRRFFEYTTTYLVISDSELEEILSIMFGWPTCSDD